MNKNIYILISAISATYTEYVEREADRQTKHVSLVIKYVVKTHTLLSILYFLELTFNKNCPFANWTIGVAKNTFISILLPRMKTGKHLTGSTLINFTLP